MSPLRGRLLRRRLGDGETCFARRAAAPRGVGRLVLQAQPEATWASFSFWKLRRSRGLTRRLRDQPPYPIHGVLTPAIIHLSKSPQSASRGSDVGTPARSSVPPLRARVPASLSMPNPRSPPATIIRRTRMDLWHVSAETLERDGCFQRPCRDAHLGSCGLMIAIRWFSLAKPRFTTCYPPGCLRHPSAIALPNPRSAKTRYPSSIIHHPSSIIHHPSPILLSQGPPDLGGGALGPPSAVGGRVGFDLILESSQVLRPDAAAEGPAALPLSALTVSSSQSLRAKRVSRRSRSEP